MKLEVIYKNRKVKKITTKIEVLREYGDHIECVASGGRGYILYEDALIITLDDRVVYIDEEYDEEKTKEFREKLYNPNGVMLLKWKEWL